MEKDQRRRSVLAQMKQLSEGEHAERSFAIKNRLLQSPVFQQAHTIGITIARFPEVNTRPIIEAAWEAGKRVTVPKCIRSSKEMDFRMIESFSQLEVVYMDLEEPITTETKAIEKDAIDLQIVPGVVFSNGGFRIGYGGGYYDRYMATFNGNSLSLAFHFQTGQVVPVEAHDIPVQQIITDNATIHCR